MQTHNFLLLEKLKNTESAQLWNLPNDYVSIKTMQAQIYKRHSFF